MNRSLAVVLVSAAALALMLRLPKLEQRPMHNDEAVNAIKFGRLWEKGSYQYDPNEHHGPSLYYATYALGRLTSAPDFEHYTENRLRLVTVLFGLGLVLLVPLIAGGLGRSGTAWAALFLAISPALVFYSRYFIHEILLAFFTFLALLAGWRYWHSRRIGWGLLAGVALGLMQSTKETFVIAVGAALVAIWLNHTWNRLLDASGAPVPAPRLNYWHLAAGLAVWLVVALVLFTSFFSNSKGLLDPLRTYQPWMSRAAGESPHIHPWHFYLHRLLWFHAAEGPVWTEGLILLLALLGGVAGFRRRRLADADANFVRFLALYTFLLTAFYSLIAYKTPWCLLSFWQTMALLAGVGAASVLRTVRRFRWQLAVRGLLLVGAGHLVWQAWLGSTTYSADPRNPYVYAQTSPDILKLVSRVEALAGVSSQGKQMVVKVIAPEDDYWPLPWYLRAFKNVGWWDHLPEDPSAPVMIVSTKLRAALDERQTHLMPAYFELRPGSFLELYVEKQLWQTWLAKQPPQPE